MKSYIIILCIINYIQSINCLQGKYSNTLSSGYLIKPVKTDYNGIHISYNLTHYHDDEDNRNLHYHLPLRDKKLLLDLSPNENFIAPLMVVERHKRDLRTRNRPSKNSNCHYIGKIRNEEDSLVALSSCNGIAGHIRNKNEEYFIEPSKHHKFAGKNAHPHVVYHRSSLPDKNRKNNKKRKSHKKNCGTKEPKRKFNTKLEWQNQGKVVVQKDRKYRKHFNIPHSNKRRIKRSVSRPHFVEALIVADSTMSKFHDDLEQYLLTIMNMVSSLYKDPTIGNAIEVVVSKIVVLEDDEDDVPLLNLTDNAQHNLETFCSYQFKLNTADENDPNHHDVGVLITRKNICGSNCETLGLANVGGMCKPRKSCSVNEDNGIMLSHTIAHELGHNFGMFHDTMKIGCHPRIGNLVHIMTPTFVADTIHVSWSNCSRRYITHFLDQGYGKCLDDEPSKMESYPDLPPGAMFNADLQCRLQYNVTDDDNTKVCSTHHEICSQLWCEVNGECISNMRPAASGTKCGKHKWCQNGHCVPIEEEPQKVDGGWGNWTEWDECSRACGGGISIQTRQCNNPEPASGGSYCIGERKRYQVCNKEKCPENEPNFRAKQCSKFNNSTYQNTTYKWLPHFDKYNPCKLFCTDEDESVIANWADTVIDGTPCEIGTKNMCIDGICRKVGCDWNIDSFIAEDRCGVCGGNDDKCEPIKGTILDEFTLTNDEYIEILTIPAGARHITVKELNNSLNFLSVGKTNSSKFYLNGNRYIYMPGEYIIAGVESMYDRENDKETIRIPSPVQKSITFYVIAREVKNDGISYEFTLPILNETLQKTYAWKLGDWSACSATCNGGIQYRVAVCTENLNTIGDEELCWSNAENQRPTQINRICNDISCPTNWWAGLWQLCPVTCKRINESEPVKRRSVLCLDHNDIVLTQSRCNIDEKPKDTKPCNLLINCSDENN